MLTDPAARSAAIRASATSPMVGRPMRRVGRPESPNASVVGLVYQHVLASSATRTDAWFEEVHHPLVVQREVAGHAARFLPCVDTF